MNASSSSHRASPTPIHRVVLVATLALLAAATTVAWQPPAALPSTVVDSMTPATAIAMHAT